MENNEGAVVAPETTAGDGETKQEAATVSLTRDEYEKLNQTLGSLKRELKDLKKPKETAEETSQKTDTSDTRSVERLEKLAMKTAGISHQDDVDLARKTAKKWGMGIEDVLEDEDFKAKLERQQTARANAAASSNVKGDKSGGSTSAKESADYWIAKGERPSRDQVPDRKTRATIIRSMMKNASTNGKTFYND